MSDNVAKIAGITREELKEIISEALQKEFIACGLLASTPAEKAEMQEDFRHLRFWRRFVEGAASKIGYTVIATLISAVSALVLLGLNAKLGKY